MGVARLVSFLKIASDAKFVHHTHSMRRGHWQQMVHVMKKSWNELVDNNHLNTLRPRQNGRHFTDDIFKCIFMNENVWFPIKISLKVVPKGLIKNIPALVQIMAWRLQGDKSLSEPVMVRLLTHICVTQPQWVKWYIQNGYKTEIFAVHNIVNSDTFYKGT